MAFVKHLVSKEKRRYKKNGFDLDLSYVTERIIAMGFPSENVEGVYRNPMKEVLRFLDSYHKDHYKVYNLCSERGYDVQKFYNRVGIFPFDDHNAPPFDLILAFCQDVQEWLSSQKENIAVIHCKAGKGRTGLMICAWLLYSGTWKTPAEALEFYAAMRTFNKKGVTIPSQIRYVHYFHESLGLASPIIEPKLLLLNRVVFHTLPHAHHASDINFTVHVGKTLVFTYKEFVEKTRAKDEPKVVKVDNKKDKKKDKEKDKDKKENGKEKEHDTTEANGKEKEEAAEVLEDTATYECGGIPVCGDVKMDFEAKGSRIFAFWFNTAFVKDLHLVVSKEGLDKGYKDKHHKLYDENFRVELVFSEMTNPKSSSSLHASPSANSIASTTTTTTSTEPSVPSSSTTTTTTTTTPTTIDITTTTKDADGVITSVASLSIVETTSPEDKGEHSNQEEKPKEEKLNEEKPNEEKASEGDSKPHEDEKATSETQPESEPAKPSETNSTKSSDTPTPVPVDSTAD